MFQLLYMAVVIYAPAVAFTKGNLSKCIISNISATITLIITYYCSTSLLSCVFVLYIQICLNCNLHDQIYQSVTKHEIYLLYLCEGRISLCEGRIWTSIEPITFTGHNAQSSNTQYTHLPTVSALSLERC